MMLSNHSFHSPCFDILRTRSEYLAFYHSLLGLVSVEADVPGVPFFKVSMMCVCMKQNTATHSFPYMSLSLCRPSLKLPLSLTVSHVAAFYTPTWPSRRA